MTAAVLIPLFLGAVFALPAGYFGGLLALVVLAAAWEWAELCGFRQRSQCWAYIAVTAGGLWLADRVDGTGLIAVLGLTLVWWLAAGIWVLNSSVEPSPGSGGTRLRDAGIGLLVLIPAWLALVALRDYPGLGPSYVVVLMLLIWGADSAAYFVGRRWGRTALAPRVSPGKTWEGLFAGLLTAALIGLLGGVLLGQSGWMLIGWLILAVVTVAISVVGDLFESLFKRRLGVKDSGRLLPGHGGMLDRIDSITAAAPIFVLGVFAAGIPT